MATGGKQRDTKEARERARIYDARRTFHLEQSRRRTRDNLIAGIGGGLLILAVIGGQTAYFVGGPGAPTPAPTASMSPAPTSIPTDPAAEQTPEATPSPDVTP